MTNDLKVLDHTGDTQIRWNPSNRDETQAAREHFDSMKAKGYLAYALDADGARGEVIRKFDPQARSIVMTPQMQGG